MGQSASGKVTFPNIEEPHQSIKILTLTDIRNAIAEIMIILHKKKKVLIAK